MTKTEMNRRIAEMSPRAVSVLERNFRKSSYTPREMHSWRIPGALSLAHINAVFQKVESEQ